jgi:hypothetical protein
LLISRLEFSPKTTKVLGSVGARTFDHAAGAFGRVSKRPIECERSRALLNLLAFIHYLIKTVKPLARATECVSHVFATSSRNPLMFQRT